MPRGHLRHQITAAALPASRQDLAPPISLFRNDRESREMLPLWMGLETYTASTGVLSRIHRFPLFRNGSELRKTLPLWKVPETHTAATSILSRIHRFSLFRNGSESREMLPLWRPLCHEGVESAGSPGREWVSLWNLSWCGGVCPDIFCSFVAKVEFL